MHARGGRTSLRQNPSRGMLTLKFSPYSRADPTSPSPVITVLQNSNYCPSQSGLIAEFNGFGMSTPSAPTGASTIVAATKWRQHVAVDVSPQNRFALRIKPRSGDRKDRCRHFVAFEICAVIFCGLTSTAIRCRHYRGWYAEHKARSQQSEVIAIIRRRRS